MKTGIRILSALCALLLFILPSTAQISDAHVSLRVEERALKDVVQFLREESGHNLVVIQGGDVLVSLELTNVPWRDALDLAAEKAGCVVEERTAGVLAVVEPPKVTFQFEDTEMRSIIDLIASVSGANIVMGDSIGGSLSLRLTDVPWRDALDVVVKTQGYTIVEEQRGILRVVDPGSQVEQLFTRSYTLRYVRPNAKYEPIINSEFVVSTKRVGAAGGAGGGGIEEQEKTFPLLRALRKALSPEGDMEYISTSNVLIVRDTAQVHSEMGKIISKIDIEPAQVFLDVKFVSTSNSDLFNLGVDYGEFGPQVSASGGQIPITFPFNQGSGGFEDVLIANGGGTGPFTDAALNAGSTIVPDTVFGALSFTGVLGTLRLLQRDTTTEVVQHPKLIALDGQEATIFVGETIRYASAKSEQGQAGGLQLSVTEASGSPVETGFQLLVIPNVIPGSNRVMMQIIPKETSLVGTGDPSVAPPGFDVFTVGASGLEGSIALPRERSSTIVTSMLLDSGQTAVVGGLTTEFDQETTQSVPGLSKIPLIGWLFQHEERARTKSSLLVFVTPTVIRTAAENQALLDRELRNRHGEYGERLRQILYGTEPDFDRGHVLAPLPGVGEKLPEAYVLSEDMEGEEPAKKTEK